jgi:outer membrane protein OmpA-like peptidoglycan-associated protein
MRTISVTAPVLAALFASACAGTSSDQSAALQRAEQRQHEAEALAVQAQQDAARSREEARKAREEARESARAEHEAREQAEWAMQQAALAEERDSRPGRSAPRMGSTELQAGPDAEGPFLFGPARVDLSPESRDRLDVLAARLRPKVGSGKMVIMVEGYGDDYLGAESHNVDLSRQRAEAVAAYLVTKGIPPDRVHTKALGSHNPVGTRDSGLNRRVLVAVEVTK